MIEPYDLALSWLSDAKKREWSQRVLDALVEVEPTLQGMVVEIYAGADYSEHGLTEGLRALGATVRLPE